MFSEQFDKPDSSGVAMLQDEIESIIIRYAEESDVTISEAIGVLEIVKHELLANAEEESYG